MKSGRGTHERTAEMIETFVLVMGALPFVVGLYALRKINNDGDEGSDDQPPPPDPEPPRPVLPPSPRQHRTDRSLRAGDRPVISRRTTDRPVRRRVSMFETGHL